MGSCRVCDQLVKNSLANAEAPGWCHRGSRSQSLGSKRLEAMGSGVRQLTSSIWYRGGFLHLQDNSGNVGMLSPFSCVWVFVTPWMVVHQAPLSMEFSRQEYWSGLPFPPPLELPNPETEPRSPALLADSSPSESLGKPIIFLSLLLFFTSAGKFFATSATSKCVSNTII